MKNKIHYSFLLSITVIGSLLLLSIPGRISVDGLTLKKIDLLADIRHPGHDSLPAGFDSIKLALQNLPTDSSVVKKDSVIHIEPYRCPDGITCIEDYSGDGTALRSFLTALSRTRETSGKLRIAFYGDSFIEGDVFCGAFRDTLQTVFGGRGVGYVPITSHVTGFRNTIRHRFDNWSTLSLVDNASGVKIGPAGFTFVPLENNWVEFKPSKQRYLREFNEISLFYESHDSTVLYYRADTIQRSVVLNVSGKLEEWRYQGDQIKSVYFQFEPFDSLLLYGASFERGGGVYVDNFSIRGNSGLNLNRIEAETFREFNRYRDYKLIILQFGLNLVTSENLNYSAYVRRMVRIIASLKKSFPQSSFLLLSVSDRSVNHEGEYRTMEAIPLMRDAQRLIARESQIAFWDMFEAMGGEGSMVNFVNATPALGARDYTHLTFRGGRKLSGMLAKSLLHELDRFESFSSPPDTTKRSLR